MMKVLAIGGSGFIGAHVVRRLVDQGHEVAVFHRGGTHAELPRRVHHIRGDRTRLADARLELDRFAADVVLDAIAYTERQARGLVDAFRGRASRVVVMSSADVYRNYDGFRGKATAPPDPVPLAEDAPLRETRYPYRGHRLPFADGDDYDKILVEQVLLDEPELPATVLRLPAVYGPGDKQRRLAPYVRRMRDGRTAILLAEEESRWR
jgi:nucleoside-diphosphate-sugar epimerase